MLFAPGGDCVLDVAAFDRGGADRIALLVRNRLAIRRPVSRCSVRPSPGRRVLPAENVREAIQGVGPVDGARIRGGILEELPMIWFGVEHERELAGPELRTVGLVTSCPS